MAKRMTLMLISVAAAVTVLGAVKYNQVQGAIAQGAAYRPPPEAITTIVARQERWDDTLSAIGTVTAVNGVTVAADLPGIVERIAFESGRTVRRGDVLVKLDSRQEDAQLKAADAQRELARLQLDRVEGLRRRGVASQSELDNARAEFAQADARVGEIQATIARKMIRAPFSGILGIRQVNLGQYLPGGGAIVPLQSLQPIYVDFTVPQQESGSVGEGTTVTVTPDPPANGGAVEPLTGRVAAVDSVVDPSTRNVRVRAEFDNPDETLRPGMFVEAHVTLGAPTSVVTLPATAISYAPYGDSVFVVEELDQPDGTTYVGVRQQFVQVGGSRGDQVAILTGVRPGESVVTSGVFKLRNGAAVVVNNDVQPGNDPAPEPEDS
ncbi:MAG TPA: efflux RND transporter periplasmic adaptor subunit [Thermoanaerobaculales bacterium]|nr:efflux RND transporter periplasmic adaptor subunit [Thermoanaerobaculales bacterium]HPA79491.1 efflux RND transporter periplasmic adaptor subunit [Thermoanaerobaculales bacterium]HQL29696.1 efflux RND transporter periplasmic adaptor subunit [Thermoanaerobaculales bacterium]HQN95430.1 efflux RND transporter periplasmic adaptor subunit [Thermoanaerobaculales bacterium]